MQFQITNAGIDALIAAGGPVQLSTFKLGGAFGYIPTQTETDIHGTVVHVGVPSDPELTNPNIYRYIIYMDNTVGPFQFGELGLYLSDGTLFGIGVRSSLLEKKALGSGDNGNALRIDAYLSMVGSNYTMTLDLADSDTPMTLASVNSVDQLPPAFDATPNAYIVGPALPGEPASLAYTDRNSLWAFDKYTTFAGEAEVDSISLSTINAVGELPSGPVYLGELLLQVIDGPARGVTRLVESIVNQQITLVTAFSVEPLPGDTLQFIRKDGGSDVDSTVLHRDSAGAPFFATRIENVERSGSRSIVFSLPVGLRVPMPTITVYDVATREVVDAPISDVSSISGLLSMTLSTTVATRLAVSVSGVFYVASGDPGSGDPGDDPPENFPVMSLNGLTGTVSIVGATADPGTNELTLPSGGGAVSSVAGRTGDITLSADDISNLAPVAVTGDYTDLINTPVSGVTVLPDLQADVTLQASHNNHYFRFTNAVDPYGLFILPNVDNPIPVGFQFTVRAQGEAPVFIVASESGGSQDSIWTLGDPTAHGTRKVIPSGGTVRMVKVGTDSWDLEGDVDTTPAVYPIPVANEFLIDNFIGTSSSPLLSHTADSGGLWVDTLDTQYNPENVIIDSTGSGAVLLPDQWSGSMQSNVVAPQLSMYAELEIDTNVPMAFGEFDHTNVEVVLHYAPNVGNDRYIKIDFYFYETKTLVYGAWAIDGPYETNIPIGYSALNGNTQVQVRIEYDHEGSQIRVFFDSELKITYTTFVPLRLPTEPGVFEIGLYADDGEDSVMKSPKINKVTLGTL